MHRISSSLSPFLLMLFSVSLLVAQPVTGDSEITEEESYNWQLVKKKNGVEIYLRAVEGSNLKQCKVVAVINAPSDEILALLTDPSKNPEWIPNYKDSKLLKKVNEFEYYSYTKIVTPWYAQNRDIVFNTSFRLLNSGGFIIHSVGVPEYMPVVEGYVRVPKFDVNWVAKEVTKKQTLLTQHLVVSPGGNVSDRVANSQLGGSAYRTIISLKNRMERGRKRTQVQE